MTGQPLVRRGWKCVAFATTLAILGWTAPSRAGVTINTATLPGGSTYDIVADPAATWASASTDANAADGHLASITTAAEQAFVQQLLNQASAPAGSYWIGLTQTSSGFAWSTGEPLTYANWLPGQPDNNGGNETVVAILWSNPGDVAAGTPGTWNDLPNPYFSDQSVYDDLNNGGYIIERSAAQTGSEQAPAAVPLPSAATIGVIGLVVAFFVIRRTQCDHR